MLGGSLSDLLKGIINWYVRLMRFLRQAFLFCLVFDALCFIAFKFNWCYFSAADFAGKILRFGNNSGASQAMYSQMLD